MKRTSATPLLTALFIALPAVAFAATPKENWDQHCARCHAADGSGKTRLGEKMKLKDYTKAAGQALFTDAVSLAAIRDGVVANGKPVMNPYSEKLSVEEIAALVPFIRGLEVKPAPTP